MLRSISVNGSPHPAPGALVAPSTSIGRLAVFLPAYNASGTLTRALSTTLAQTHTDFLLVVIDDGSTDDTQSIVRQFAATDKRIVVISHENLGMGEALNRAIAQTESDWVFRMDADDEMEPNRLERQIAFLEEHPEVGLAASNVTYINARGKLLGRYSSPYVIQESVLSAFDNNYLIAFHHPTAAFRRQSFLDVGGYRPQFWPADDIDLWLRMIEAGTKFLVQPECLLRYRIHGSSVCVSRSLTSTQRLAWVKACMVSRRSGAPEPTLVEFNEARSLAGPVSRLRRRCSESGQSYYKAAVVEYANGNTLLAIQRGVCAFVLAPRFVLRKVLLRRLW